MIDRFRNLISALLALACRLILIAACGVPAYGLAVTILCFPVIGWVLLGYVFHRQPLASVAYGSARTASAAEAERAGLFSDRGPILGRFLADRPSLTQAVRALLSPSIRSDWPCRIFLAAVFGRGWLNSRLIRPAKFVHLASFSPTGGGKGVGVMIPNLLSYPGNCVVNDPSGGLFKETAEHRRRQFGHRVIRLDPFEVCGPGGDTLNPLSFIDPEAKDFVDQVADLADQIVIRQHDEKDPHWNESAIKNVKAFGSFVCGAEKRPEKRHLGTVRALTSSRGKYAQAVEVMQQMGDACNGVIARLGGDLTWHEGEELSSVMSTLGRHLGFLDSPVIARNVATSSFDPKILRTGKATIYLILPHESLSTMSRWLRLQIGTIMRRSTRGFGEQNPVLWLLDEMAHIGHMQVIEDAASLLRAKGVRLWFVFQSLRQLKECFGEKAGTVLDNIGSQQYFSINSMETARELSERIGDTTIAITSENDTTGDSHSTGSNAHQQGGNRSRSRSITHSEIARRLLKPEEVLTLPDDLTLIFHKNLPVIPARLVKYYNAPEFRRRWLGFGARGTARPRRLGLVACFLAAVILLASAFVTQLALSFDPPQPGPQWPGRGGYGQRRAYRPNPWQWSPEQDFFNFWDPSTWAY
jgi:type IV secretion system protein VirD4